MSCYLQWLQYSMQKLTIGVVLKMFSIAVVQTKVISCNSAKKNCLLQVVHTKAIAALTQFCDFFTNIYLFNSTKLILLDSLLQEVTGPEFQIATCLYDQAYIA